jgi:hypothetical protein
MDSLIFFKRKIPQIIEIIAHILKKFRNPMKWEVWGKTKTKGLEGIKSIDE